MEASVSEQLLWIPLLQAGSVYGQGRWRGLYKKEGDLVIQAKEKFV